MSLLPRFSKLALLFFVLLALTSISGTWSPQSTGSWLSAPPAWAGSPDETLKPKPNPASRLVPTKLQATSNQGSVTGSRMQVVTLRTWFGHSVLVWKISLASVLRF